MTVDSRTRRSTGTAVNLAYPIVKLATAPIRRGLIRLEVQGRDQMPAAGPVIVTANHLSFLDSVLLMFSMPRPVSVLGKAEYTGHPVTRWLFCGAGMIPVNRSTLAGLLRALDTAAAVLAEGGAVGIFPEGTRSRDGLLHRGHPGAAHLAMRTGAPILPVGIQGTDQVQPIGTHLLRPFRRAVVRIGSLIEPPVAEPGRSNHVLRRALTDEVMQAIRTLSRQRYVNEYAPLPAG